MEILESAHCLESGCDQEHYEDEQSLDPSEPPYCHNCGHFHDTLISCPAHGYPCGMFLCCVN